MYRLFILILLAGLYSCQTDVKKEINSTQTEKKLKKETLVDSFLIEIMEKYDPSFFLDTNSRINLSHNYFTFEVQKEIINDTLLVSKCQIADIYLNNEKFIADFVPHYNNFYLQLEVDSIQLNKIILNRVPIVDKDNISNVFIRSLKNRIVFTADSIVKVNEFFSDEYNNLSIDVISYKFLIKGKLIEIYFEDEED